MTYRHKSFAQSEVLLEFEKLIKKADEPQAYMAETRYSLTPSPQGSSENIWRSSLNQAKTIDEAEALYKQRENNLNNTVPDLGTRSALIARSREIAIEKIRELKSQLGQLNQNPNLLQVQYESPATPYPVAQRKTQTAAGSLTTPQDKKSPSSGQKSGLLISEEHIKTADKVITALELVGVPIMILAGAKTKTANAVIFGSSGAFSAAVKKDPVGATLNFFFATPWGDKVAHFFMEKVMLAIRGIGYYTGLGAGGMSIAAGLAAFLYPNKNIMSESEEQKLLVESKKAAQNFIEFRDRILKDEMTRDTIVMMMVNQNPLNLTSEQQQECSQQIASGWNQMSQECQMQINKALEIYQQDEIKLKERLKQLKTTNK
jgi:hypothetical protein